MTWSVRLVAVVVCLLLWPAAAGAQLYESVGTRAQGMAGAFVAVANDATATWWNPAGLASGAYVSMLFERGRWTDPSVPAPAGPASRETETAFAFAVPSMGLSYYRLRISEIAPSSSTGSEASGRQEDSVGLRTRAFSQYGLTVGQSISDGLVVASTLKLVRAGSASAIGPGDQGGDEALTLAHEVPVSVDTKGDLDLGAMLLVGRAKVGFVVKHLNEPEFEAEDGPFVLKRQIRVGTAVSAGAVPGALQGITLAFDADLTETPTVFGDVRHLAGGVEAWLGGWVGLRGGVSANTIGDARTAWSAGVSVGAGSGLFLDLATTFGGDASKEGWNVGGRLTF